MSYNTPYEEQSPIPEAIGLTSLTAAGFGLYKYNTSSTFRENITGVINKHISRVEKTPYTNMQEGVNIAATSIARGEAKSVETNRILREDRLSKDNTKYSGYKFSKGEAISQEVLKGKKSYGFTNLNSIENIHGQNITNDLVGAITDRLGIGQDAIISQGVEGNNLVLEMMLGGGKREKLTVPLWQREGNSWIHKGSNTTVGKLTNVATRDSSGRIISRITDPNSGLLQAIDDTRMFDYYNALSKGGKDNATAARNILNLSTQELIEEEKRKFWELKRVISTYSQSAGEHVASMELGRQNSWIAKQIRLDPKAAHNIGFGDVIGSNIADFGEGSKASGYNGLLDYAKHVQGLREGKEEAIRIATWDRKAKGFNDISTSKLRTQEESLLKTISSNISSSLSQGQTGEGTTTFFNTLGDIHAPEALKSLKGYYYTDDPKNLRYIKTNKTKTRAYNSASRTSPQYELPIMSDADELIASVKSRGHINIPMQLSPFHDEAMILQPRVLNKKIGKNIDLRLDELVTEGDSPVSDIFKQILNDPEYKIVDGLDIKLDKGTVLGKKRRVSNLKNSKELRLNAANEFDVITSPYEMRVTSDHLRKFQELNKNKKLSESFVLPVEYIDNQIKVGNLTDSTRGSIASAEGNSSLERYSFTVGDKGTYTKAINNALSDNLGTLPEGEMSFNHFKNTIPRIEKTIAGKSNIVYGKGRGAYLGLLRGLTIGNLQMSDTEMLASGNMKDLFLKHTNIEELYNKAGLKIGNSINIGKAQRELGGLSFKRVTGDLDETIKEYQQITAGTIYLHKQKLDGTIGDISKKESEELLSKTFIAQEAMQKFTQDQVLGKQLSELPEELKNLITSGKIGLDDLSKLNYMGDIVPHESKAMTLGKGTGIYRQSALDLSLAYDMPAVQEELAARNQVQTTKLMRENKLMMKSASDSFSADDIKEFEEATGQKLKVLESSDIQNLLNDPFLQDITEATSAVKSPETFFNSIFSPENNPNGFLLRTKSAKGEMGHFYMGSGDMWGGMISLQDGTYRPAKDDVYTMARALASASETGVLQGRALDNLLEETGKSYISNMKNASMQIEGRMYDKLIDSQFLTDTHKKLSQISSETAKDLDFITGSVTLVSKDAYESSVARQIEDAAIQAKVKGSTTIDVLDSILGEGNDISSYMRRAGQNESASNIAKGMSLESQQSWEKIKGLVNTEVDSALNEHRAVSSETFNQIHNIIKDNGSVNFWDRTPNLYPKSANVTFGFVDNTLNEWNIAGGHVVKELMNADTDGDAIRHMMLYQKNVRIEAAKHINSENRLAYDWMTKVSEQKILKGMVTPASSEFTPITDAMKNSYSSFMKSLETEQAAAAYITKNVTGVATTRAWTQLGYYEDKLMQNKNLSEDTVRNARYFLNTFVSKTGPQSTISAKLARGIYSPSDNKMLATTAAVLDNLGTVYAESLSRSVKDLGQVHNLTTWIMTDLMRPNNEDALKKLNKDNLINDMGEVLNFQHNWKRITDEQAIKRIHSRGWLGSEGETLEDFSRRLTNVQNTEKMWITEDETLLNSGIIQKNQNLLDWLSEPIYKVKSESTSWSAAEAVAIRNLKENNPKNYISNSEELTRMINSQLISKGLKRDIGEQAALGVRQAEKRVYPFLDKVAEFATKNMTPRNIAVGAGAALIGFAALNLISGDGTPSDPNDIPSYNNPSFNNTSYNDMNERYKLEGGHNTNISTSLLTNQGSQTGLMGRINNIVGVRGYNSSTLISDGSSPYKQDMYRYGN